MQWYPSTMVMDRSDIQVPFRVGALVAGRRWLVMVARAGGRETVAGEAWVAGVVGWDEGPFAFAFDEGPAVLGFLAVVVTAQAVEEVEGGEVGFGVVVAMVVLEPVP